MFAAIIGHRLGVAFEDIRRAIENFSGMGRRFERLGTVQGARIIDDYAHHPTEVSATLKGAQEFNRYGGGRVIAVFQPHRYQRLKALWDEFTQAFEDADEVIVVDVYSAGEAPIEGINSRQFVEALHHHAKDYWPSTDWNLVLARLKTILTPGDLLITMGAGDITQLGRTLVAQS
jgi:UDP-N-acetylmuramate--alanine ligase